jgi:hypothetical protein
LDNFLREIHEEEQENVESIVQTDVRYDFDPLHPDKQRIGDEVHVPDENSVEKSKWRNPSGDLSKESGQPALVDA